MTDLVQQLEQMRMRMNQQAQQESNLLAELSDALRSMDHQLLQDVRTLTAEHEARRETILCELQVLAARLNSFPGRGDAAPSLPNAGRGMLASGANAPSELDWEQRSASIREALNNHVNYRALAG